MTSIAGKYFIAAITRERNGDVLARQLADTVGRNRRAVRKRLVVNFGDAINQREIVGIDLFDMVVGRVFIRQSFCE